VFDTEVPEFPEARIQVVGVGALGRSVVDFLEAHAQVELSLIACDQDLSDLSFGVTKGGLASHVTSSPSHQQSGDAAWGWLSSAHDREALVQRLSATDLVFVVTDLASPHDRAATRAISQIAREINAMTIIIAPDSPESDAHAALLEAADSVIFVSREQAAKAESVAADNIRASSPDTYMATSAVLSIANSVAFPGLVNVDLDELRNALAGTGPAHFGMGSATGHDGANLAAKQAMARAGVGEGASTRAAGVLVNVTAGDALGLSELNDAISSIQDAAGEDANVVYGVIIDDSVGAAFHVSVVVTGLAR